MSDLGVELLRVLESGEVLRADSFPSILHAVGFDRPSPMPITEIETALVQLVDAGDIEIEWRRGRRYYRAVNGDASGR